MTSQMATEIQEAPQAVARLLSLEDERVATLGRHLAASPPISLLTIARGSSDHAAHYLAYLVMARLGRVVASLPMSLITLQGTQLVCDQLMAVAFSQSGQSPDLLAPVQHVNERGGRSLALVNDTASPLARAAQHLIPLHAGPERSIAATKSFIAQMAASAALVAAWEDHPVLRASVLQLPERLEAALAQSWFHAAEALVGVDRLYVIGRGTGLPVAQEMALKLKEVCGIQAEAYSSAEVRHGPMTLVEPGFTVLVLAPDGPAQAGLLNMAQQMRQQGARVLLAAPAGIEGCDLPLPDVGHEDLAPITAIARFYGFAEALARMRGRNPDSPPHLQKVTRTH
ncbi:MAG: SIS domain-containing protein [Burkholderiaceae bacterium]